VKDKTLSLHNSCKQRGFVQIHAGGRHFAAALAVRVNPETPVTPQSGKEKENEKK